MEGRVVRMILGGFGVIRRNAYRPRAASPYLGVSWLSAPPLSPFGSFVSPLLAHLGILECGFSAQKVLWDLGDIHENTLDSSAI